MRRSRKTIAREALDLSLRVFFDHNESHYRKCDALWENNVCSNHCYSRRYIYWSSVWCAGPKNCRDDGSAEDVLNDENDFPISQSDSPLIEVTPQRLNRIGYDRSQRNLLQTAPKTTLSRRGLRQSAIRNRLAEEGGQRQTNNSTSTLQKPEGHWAKKWSSCKT